MISFVKSSQKLSRWQNKSTFTRIGAASVQAASFRSSTLSQTIVSGTRFPELGAVKKSYHTSRLVASSTPMSHVIIESTPQILKYDAIIKPVDLTGPRSLDWYTGKVPLQDECAGVVKGDIIHSLPQLTFPGGHTTKKALQDYFDNTWALTEVLLACLQGEEAFMVPPYHDLRHPMIFYYGHPAALYINKLRVAGLLTEPINPYFEVIFETGVDEMSWDDLSKNKMPWPAVDEVRQYRAQVYQTVSDLIQNLTPEQLSSVHQDSPMWALVLAFEHERIHIETSSVLITELPLKYVKMDAHMPRYHPSIPQVSVSNDKPVVGTHYQKNQLISVPAQTISMGKPVEYPSFGWDNEYGYRKYEVNEFKASQYKVSNGEYFEFVSDGGYARREFWSDVGWEWRAFRNVKHPTFWVRRGPQGNHVYDLRLLCDVVPMPWDWPAAVNYHEAEAFTKWKNVKEPSKHYRVLSELEHHAIRDIAPGDKSVKEYLEFEHVAHKSGDQMLSYGVNTNMSVSSMSPVQALPPTSQGFYDVFGNAWEWTMDKFCALPGFEVHKYYEDFSTPCFDGLHYVIQGGSFISTGHEASVFARYHFRPHFYQHSSFRLVEQSLDLLMTSDTDAPGPYVGNYPFRRSNEAMMKLVNKATEREQSKAALLSKNFGLDGQSSPMQVLADLIVSHAHKFKFDFSSTNALDVGSGPGGLTFLLAGSFNSVIGVDHHSDNVDTARKLLSGDYVPYFLTGEGELSSKHSVHVKSGDLTSKMIEFRQADPMCLPAEMSGFNVVVLNDVIDKVSSPNSVLGRLGGVRGLVKKDGLLLVISAYEWNDNTTPKSLWLGGYVDKSTGEVVSSEQGLIDRLSEDFDVVYKQKVPIQWYESQNERKTKDYNAILFQRK